MFVRVCWGCLGGALGRSGEVVYGCGVYFSFEGNGQRWTSGLWTVTPRFVSDKSLCCSDRFRLD